jgi:hypothetical protein
LQGVKHHSLTPFLLDEHSTRPLLYQHLTHLVFEKAGAHGVKT